MCLWVASQILWDDRMLCKEHERMSSIMRCNRQRLDGHVKNGIGGQNLLLLHRAAASWTASYPGIAPALRRKINYV